MSTISLLIPAYNAAAYLPRLLTSASTQTVNFDEIWVYDDCSTDDTAEVAARLGARVVRGERNLGCSAGKNVLAGKAGTEWVHFHDADDELMPHFVECARTWMDKAVDVVLFAYEERDDRTGEAVGLRRFDHAQASADARSYAIREQINPFCGLYRLAAYKAAGGYDEDPRVLYNEDVAFHIRMAFAGLRFAADETVTVINHRRMNSMSSANGRKCAVAHLAVMKKALADERSAPYQAEIGRNLWGITAILAAHSAWSSVNEALALAKRLSPATGSRAFRAACRISPYLAVFGREALVRLTRPHLRRAHA